MKHEQDVGQVKLDFFILMPFLLYLKVKTCVCIQCETSHSVDTVPLKSKHFYIGDRIITKTLG